MSQTSKQHHLIYQQKIENIQNRIITPKSKKIVNVTYNPNGPAASSTTDSKYEQPKSLFKLTKTHFQNAYNTYQTILNKTQVHEKLQKQNFVVARKAETRDNFLVKRQNFLSSNRKISGQSRPKSEQEFKKTFDKHIFQRIYGVPHESELEKLIDNSKEEIKILVNSTAKKEFEIQDWEKKNQYSLVKFQQQSIQNLRRRAHSNYQIPKEMIDPTQNEFPTSARQNFNSEYQSTFKTAQKSLNEAYRPRSQDIFDKQNRQFIQSSRHRIKRIAYQEQDMPHMLNSAEGFIKFQQYKKKPSYPYCYVFDPVNYQNLEVNG